jgi:hypothetical protein
VTDRPVPIDALRRALEVVSYELERHPERYRCQDAIEALDELRLAAAALPAVGAPLSETYPAVVAVAVRALAALSGLPEPTEVDGLADFGGFDLWRAQR